MQGLARNKDNSKAKVKDMENLVKITLVLVFLSLTSVAAFADGPTPDLSNLPLLDQRVVSTLFSSSDASGAPVILDHPFVLGSVIVRFSPELGTAEIGRRLEQNGVSVDLIRLSPLGLFMLKTEGARTETINLLSRVQRVGGVVRAGLDYLGSGGFVPNDTHFADQWHLDQSGPDVDAPEAWEITRGSTSDVVAILDSGYVETHLEFVNRIYSNPNDPIDGVDNDLNGFVDDSSGWDFVNGDREAIDDHGHGSWVSGVFGARADNGYVISGLNHFAKIMPLKVLDANGFGPTSALVAALDYTLLFSEIDVVSMSLINYPLSPFIANSLEAASQSAILVSCAGNGGPSTADSQYPGAHPATLSVASTTISDGLASFSSTGSTVDVSAPGASIVTISPFPPHSDSTDVVSGCSFATPLIAAAASLVLDQRPTTDSVDLRFLLARTVVDLGATGKDDAFGLGRLDTDDLLLFTNELVFQDTFETGDVLRWSSATP